MYAYTRIALIGGIENLSWLTVTQTRRASLITYIAPK